MKYFSEKTVKEMLVDFARTDTFPIREDYPHIEIPDEHGRLIDADKLREALLSDEDYRVFVIEDIDEVIKKYIDTAPTVLEASDGE